MPPRPKKYGCHGQFVEIHGISFSSHWSATGLVVSGVSLVIIMFTPSFRISSCATSAARFGFDWLSLAMISIVTGAPLLMMPPIAFCRPAMIQSCASPKPASGPVVGLTSPILKTFACADARVARNTAGAASSKLPDLMNRRRESVELTDMVSSLSVRMCLLLARSLCPSRTPLFRLVVWQT